MNHEELDSNQIQKTLLLRSSLCDHSNANTLVKRTISVAEETAAAPNKSNEKVIFKNSASFTNCISRIKNIQADNAYNSYVVMPIYNLIEYSDNYSKLCGFLQQYCRDQPAWANDNKITDFNEDNVITDLFKIKMLQPQNFQ